MPENRCYLPKDVFSLFTFKSVYNKWCLCLNCAMLKQFPPPFSFMSFVFLYPKLDRPTSNAESALNQHQDREVSAKHRF